MDVARRVFGRGGVVAGNSGGSWRRLQQLGQADQVVSSARQGEVPAHPREPPMLGLALAGDGDPGEHLFDPVPRLLTLPVAGVPGGAKIDRRAPACGVLGHMRGGPELTQLHDEVGGIVSPIGADRD
jgi:hypothetical protein